MIAWRLIAILSVLLGTSCLAEAEFMNGDRLANICQEFSSSQALTNNKVILYGYLQGLSDHALMVGAMSGTSYVCVPIGATTAQLADIVCKYVRENPTFRASGSAASVAEAALIGSFPCKTK